MACNECRGVYRNCPICAEEPEECTACNGTGRDEWGFLCDECDGEGYYFKSDYYED
jgi:DnaJ-class molecular chaperone